MLSVDSIMTMILKQKFIDAFGQPLAVGDTASYVYNDTSFLIFARVQVIGFTPKKVKVVINEYRSRGELDQDRAVKNSGGTTVFIHHPVGEEKAVMPHFLIKDGISGGA